MKLPHGRNTFHTVRECDWDANILRLKVPYVSRAIEWVKLPALFASAVENTYGVVREVEFVYHNLPTIGSQIYAPKRVFTGFSVADLLSSCSTPCPCFAPYLDPFRDHRTLGEYDGGFPITTAHVRTMDLTVVSHNRLRREMAQGMNHVPLEPTTWEPLKGVITEAWVQVTQKVTDGSDTVTIDTASGLRWILVQAFEQYTTHCDRNTGGHRFDGTSLFDLPEVHSYLEKAKQVGFWSGIDKAVYTWMFRCIRYERLQALKRLQGSEF